MQTHSFVSVLTDSYLPTNSIIIPEPYFFYSNRQLSPNFNPAIILNSK